MMDRLRVVLGHSHEINVEIWSRKPHDLYIELGQFVLWSLASPSGRQAGVKGESYEKLM